MRGIGEVGIMTIALMFVADDYQLEKNVRSRVLNHQFNEHVQIREPSWLHKNKF
jgi:hypothetical protein